MKIWSTTATVRSSPRPRPFLPLFFFLRFAARKRYRLVLEKLSTAQTDLLVLSAKYITGWFIYREDIYRLVSCRSEEQDIFVLSFWNWLASGESLSLSFSFGQRRTRQYKPMHRIRNTFDAQCDTTLSPVCRMSFYYTTKRLFAPFYLFLRSYLFLTRNVPVPTRDLHHPPERSILSLLNFIAHSRPIRSEAAFWIRDRGNYRPCSLVPLN